MKDITQIEEKLWSAADQLRSNSKLTSTQYCMPILGLIFLRFAYNKYLVVKTDIEKNLPKRGGVTRALAKEDFTSKASLYLRQESQYEYLLNLPNSNDLANSIINAMKLIEADYPTLSGVLPKDYQIFNNDLLSNLLKTFNDASLCNASGDLLGRVYEYFLMKFAMQGAQDNGEFFTPVSIVQTIVNIIEPDHGTILDPACGSGGMFVQTSHFLEKVGKPAHESVTFYGQEKTDSTIPIAKMNLAVHGLEGNIEGGNTFYEDKHTMLGKADFVMANPPFNVDEVDAEKIKADPRLPFGLPGINQKKKVSNGNYLWISYFYSYLNEKGRAGFVMSSQASSAGHGEKEVRRKLVESGHVDIMVSIGSNFFYTRTVPCELWFFDKGKAAQNQDNVLMLDARGIFRKVTRKVNDFSPEQLKNITAIVHLYRGRQKEYLSQVQEYFTQLCDESSAVTQKIESFDAAATTLSGKLQAITMSSPESAETYIAQCAEIKETFELYLKDKTAFDKMLNAFVAKYAKAIPAANKDQLKAREQFDTIADHAKGLIKQIDLVYKLLVRAADVAEKDNAITKNTNMRDINRLEKECDTARKDVVEQLKLLTYFHRHIHWLHIRFPNAEYTDVLGLVKRVILKEIEANDYSLTPGRYVGVAPQEVDEDFDFEETMRTIHTELAGLNEEAVELASVIQRNFEELGI